MNRYNFTILAFLHYPKWLGPSFEKKNSLYFIEKKVWLSLGAVSPVGLEK